jgi:small-conductance mechanosensitive channel
VFSLGSFQAKAGIIETATSLFRSNQSQPSPLEKFSNHINQAVDKTFASAKNLLIQRLSTAEQKADFLINDQVLRIGLILAISFLALALLQYICITFLQNHPKIPKPDQVILEIIPWLGFWILSLFLCEAIQLPPVPRHALVRCLTLLSIGFSVRQVSMVIYHLHHNILGEKYHKSFKRSAPSFVYYGVTAIINLSILLILGILSYFMLAWITHRPIDPNSTHALMMIDVVWYFYLLCFGFLMLALHHHQIKQLQKSKQKVSPLNAFLDKFHALGYPCLLLSFVSWFTAQEGWIDPLSTKLILVLTFFLLGVLFSQSAIKIIYTILSWFLSENAKAMLDYVSILRVLGYAIYSFIVTTLLAYALDKTAYFDILLQLGDYLFEKGFAVTVIIGTVFLINKAIRKITHRLVDSQVHLKRAERANSRLFTFLLLFRNLIPTLLWIPTSILILVTFGINSQYILYVFVLIFAAFVFVSQSLLQDIIKCFLWIAEDVIAIGDVITINHSVTGTIEHLTLQAVSVRDYAGAVHTFSFSTITTMAHHEWKYSYAVCEIAVHHEEDLDKVIDLMMKVAESIRKDPKFKSKILDDKMETPGIDNIKEYAITIKGRLKVKPGSQYDIQREYYKKLIQAFNKAKITRPYPRQDIHVIK